VATDLIQEYFDDFGLSKRQGLTLSIEQERSIYDAKFSVGVRRLERIIGRDLSCWYSRYTEGGVASRISQT
jgi:hypothetical protein